MAHRVSAGAPSAAEAARSAWAALHREGLLPASWLDDPARRFPWLADLPRHERAQELRRAPFLPLASCPDWPDGCALASAGAAAMEQAEAHGRQLVAALWPWIEPRPAGIVWVPTARDDYAYQCHDTKPGVWEPDALVWRCFPGTAGAEVGAVRAQLVGDLRQHAAPGDPLVQRQESLAAVIAPWVTARQHWARAVEHGLRPPQGAVRAAAAGRSYAELPDPFGPALALFALGFAPLPSSGDWLVLGFPVDLLAAPGGLA